MARATQKPQRSFEERFIEDPDFIDAIEHLQETQEGAKLNRQARAKVSELAEKHGIKDGEALRVGPYVVKGVLRSGGGFEVASWSKVTIGGIEDTSA